MGCTLRVEETASCARLGMIRWELRLPEDHFVAVADSMSQNLVDNVRSAGNLGESEVGIGCWATGSRGRAAQELPALAKALDHKAASRLARSAELELGGFEVGGLNSRLRHNSLPSCPRTLTCAEMMVVEKQEMGASSSDVLR
jgi:hypothetical protein